MLTSVFFIEVLLTISGKIAITYKMARDRQPHLLACGRNSR
jgi:hypothetical protein